MNCLAMFSFLAVIVFGCTTMVMADSADDDWWDDDSDDDVAAPSCDDVCSMAVFCETPCLPSNGCVEACESTLTESDRTCIWLEDCEAINNCLCPSGTVDDDADDDASDDDADDDAAGGSDDDAADDDGNPDDDNDDNDDDDDGCGCSVTSGKASGFALPVGMLAIGILAFGLGLRRSR
ncbi:MAG: MYXO-CTERM sorting domain-containing protein [Deltaproteobacteria bacterium]|nr:MYXO-CTERM sorting domain-containing protein [Deltaproteobacteria bacterium]